MDSEFRPTKAESPFNLNSILTITSSKTLQRYYCAQMELSRLIKQFITIRRKATLTTRVRVQGVNNEL